MSKQTNNEGMIKMNRQAVLDVLNSLEVIDEQGGEESYIIVELNEENLAELSVVGITKDMVEGYGTDGTDFCILAFAFSEKYADEYKNGELILWGPIDDEFRYRVLNGEGTPQDAERLLLMLEPQLLSRENCPACNGSGDYKEKSSPQCGACDGTGYHMEEVEHG